METRRNRRNQKHQFRGAAQALGLLALVAASISISLAKPGNGKGGGGTPPGQFETKFYDVEIIESATSIWGSTGDGSGSLVGRIENDDGRMLINRLSGGGANPTVDTLNLRAAADDTGATCCAGGSTGGDWLVCFDPIESGTILIPGGGNTLQQNIGSGQTTSGKPESYRVLADASGWSADPLTLATGETAEFTLSCWRLQASKDSRVRRGCTGCGDFGGTITVRITAR